MNKPRFEIDRVMGGIYAQLESKQLKPEFGNEEHIKAIRYQEDKEDFKKKMQSYCDENNLDAEFEINKALGTELDYDVIISYRGEVEYTIKAKSANEAEKLAEEKFNNECVGDLNCTD